MSEESSCFSACKRSKILEEEKGEGNGSGSPLDIENKGLEVDEEGGGDIDGFTPAFVDQYQVVKTILGYLKIRDLLHASSVNQQWLEIGKIVRRQRRNLPYAILYHPYLPHSKLAFEYFTGVEVSEEAKELVESGNDGYPAFKNMSYFGRDLGILEAARSVVGKAVRGAYDEIQMLISFGTGSFDAHLISERRASLSGKISKERMNLVLAKIPDNIPCLSSFSCGVVATLPDCNTSLEMEKKKFPCLSCLGVPKVPGLQTKLFTVTKSQNKALKKVEQEGVEQCKSLLGIDEETESSLKGILLFHKSSQRRSAVVTLIDMYLRSHPEVALAGGVHDEVFVSGTADDTIIAAGVLIYGNDLVRVSSVALTESLHSDADSCRQKLDELKSSLFPDGNSFAFMFACNGRGRYMHGRPNVESTIFNSLFPKTPLAGAFTYGEFCHEVCVPFPGVPAGVDPPSRINLAYNTILLVVSYKYPDEVADGD